MDQPATVPEDMTPEQEQFCRYYVHGDPDAERTIQGNASRSYYRAYDCKLTTARSAAFRLLKRERVRTRIAELREEARSVLDEVMPDWRDEVASAMRTLRWARTGKWPDRFAGDDQAKRSAVKAAEQTLDRALGSVKQMHEVNVNQRSILVQVAGPAHQPQEEDAKEGRQLDGGRASLQPADGAERSSGDGSSSSDPYEELLGEEVRYTG